MNEVLQNIKARRSVRAYTDRQVSAQDLDLILEAAAYAPNGMHYETWYFTAIQDAAILTELNEAIKGVFAKSDEPRLRERGQSETYCCYYHAPTLVIVSNEPTQWWAPMDCACALEIFSWQPVRWALVPVGSISWVRLAMIRKSVRCSPVWESLKIIKSMVVQL